ncbi:MAG: hypothetical protein AAB214_02310 [Fibrobacterota bacterium]
MAGTTQAGSWFVDASQVQDNYQNFQTRGAMEYSFPCSQRIYCFVDGAVSHLGSSSLAGIPGGDLVVGSAEAKIQTVAGRFLLKSGAGFVDLSRADSWTISGEARSGLPGVPGVTGRLELGSRWIEGSWLGYSVRSSKATAALALERWKTWGEMGAVVDFRNGGRDPGGSIPLQTPGNRLSTGYAWASREWTKWLMAGMSVRYTKGDVDLHQPTEIVNDTAVWADFPYQAPLDESVVEALVTLKIRKLTFVADCPVYSATKMRSDNVWINDSAYYYWASLMAPANVSLAFEAPLSNWLVGAKFHASSRPYKSGAWFRGNAWNQIGIQLTLRH